MVARSLLDVFKDKKLDIVSALKHGVKRLLDHETKKIQGVIQKCAAAGAGACGGMTLQHHGFAPY